MTKRAKDKFEKMEKNFYPTFDERAYPPLFEMQPLLLNPIFTFYEPCAGELHMVEKLESFGLVCGGYSDIRETNKCKNKKDALDLTREDLFGIDFIITNPPWTLERRDVLHKLIEHFLGVLQKPTYLLLDSDWMHTQQAAQYLNKWCTDIKSIGRLKFIENSSNDGFDNSSWYRFSPLKSEMNPVIFHPRS